MEIGTGYETSNVVHYKSQSSHDLSQESKILTSTRRMLVHGCECVCCVSLSVCVCFCCAFSLCVSGVVCFDAVVYNSLTFGPSL